MIFIKIYCDGAKIRIKARLNFPFTRNCEEKVFSGQK